MARRPVQETTKTATRTLSRIRGRGGSSVASRWARACGATDESASRRGALRRGLSCQQMGGRWWMEGRVDDGRLRATGHAAPGSVHTATVAGHSQEGCGLSSKEVTAHNRGGRHTCAGTQPTHVRVPPMDPSSAVGVRFWQVVGQTTELGCDAAVEFGTGNAMGCSGLGRRGNSST